MSAPEAVVDLQAIAHRVLGIAPVSANEAAEVVAQRDELADLRAEHDGLSRMVNGLESSLRELRREMYRLEMRVMLGEGRSHLLRYSWLEAFVEGRMEDCDAITASDEYRRELRAAYRVTP